MVGKRSESLGDPFKDTSGPSMNILIKLSTIVALIIAPHIARKRKIKDIGDNKLKLVILRKNKSFFSKNIEHIQTQY